MSILDRIFGTRKPRQPVKEAPPLISTPWGPVSESMRFQAAINMRNNADLRLAVEDKLIEEMGGDVERGLREFRRRYPETFSDLE